MCPTAMAGMAASTMFAVSLGVSAVTAGVSYISQQQNAEAQIEAQEQNLQAQRDAATKSMIQSSEDLQQRELQERASTALKIDNAKTRTMEAKATANATSQSAGLSMDSLMADYDREYAGYENAQLKQLGFNTDQISRQREGLEAQAEGRINSIPRQPVQQPSLGGTLLNFGSDALGSYQNFAARDPQTGNYTLT